MTSRTLPRPDAPSDARADATSRARRPRTGTGTGTGTSTVADTPRRRAARERLITLTRLLDTAVAVPVLRTRVGLDALLGLAPGIGDLVSGALGLYLVMEARQLGASRLLQARMIGNLLVDAVVGAVPVAGDVFDVYFKAHVRNLKLLQKELGEPFLDAPHDAGIIDVDVIDAAPTRRR